MIAHVGGRQSLRDYFFVIVYNIKLPHLGNELSISYPQIQLQDFPLLHPSVVPALRLILHLSYLQSPILSNEESIAFSGTWSLLSGDLSIGTVRSNLQKVSMTSRLCFPQN